MKFTASQIKFLRWLLRLAFISPLAYWFYLGGSMQLGPQPIVTVSRQSGYVVLTLLLVNLWLGVLMSQKWLGPLAFRWIFAERRSIGIATGFYVVLHFLAYLTKEAFEKVAFTQIFEAFYLVMGFLSMLILLLLTITSNQWSQRKLGAQGWKKLHRSVHLASVLLLFHIFLIEKGNLLLMAAMVIPIMPFQLFRAFNALMRRYRKT